MKKNSEIAIKGTSFMAANSAYRVGGLLRCCILTIQKENTPDTEGKVIQCPYCATYLLFTNNAYQWHRELDRLKAIKKPNNN